MINWQMFSVFIIVFGLVTVLGFFASRWRHGDLSRLQEWGLGGRRFGTVMSWFLISGDIYTAYTFIAIPGAVYAAGASGFFSLPYAIIGFVLFFLLMPRLWTVARHRGYVTPADFVRERFGSSSLALMMALTGILATLPYIAMQMYGIQLVISEMGVPTAISIAGIKLDIAQLIAFAIMAIYTYNGGLRAPALVAIAKDILIWLVIIVAMIYIPAKLGGVEHIFALVPAKKVTLLPDQYTSFATLTLGQALALYLYPHALTGVFSTNSRKSVQRNAILLPIYSFLLGFTGLLGFMAIAAGIKKSPLFGTNATLPALFAAMFPGWFAGFSFAAIAICALVPAAIMSIAGANLFTRNIYKEYFNPSCTEREETNVARITSLTLKFGALVFILALPSTEVINFQLLGGLWILQTLPAVFLGLFTRWFHSKALIVGWAGGMIAGTAMAVSQHFTSIYPLMIAGTPFPIYAGLAALVINLLLCYACTPIFRFLNIPIGRDTIAPIDFEYRPVPGARPTVLNKPALAPMSQNQSSASQNLPATLRPPTSLPQPSSLSQPMYNARSIANRPSPDRAQPLDAYQRGESYSMKRREEGSDFPR